MLCAATSPSVCGPRLGCTRRGYECGQEQEFDYYVDSIMDGLTSESPIMIRSDEPSNASTLFVDEDGEKEFLRAFMREKSRTALPQGLILDSTVPELAPHIVISPPADHPFESYCSCGSCDRDWPHTPPQYTDGLVVPLQQWAHSANEGLDVPCDPLEPSTVHTQCNDATQSSAGIIEAPYRVFSHSWFRHSVEAAAQERLAFYHVIPSIHKRCFRLAAVVASEVAPLFRARWDFEEFQMHMERPFTWTDPAEPLLSDYARQPNTIVIDSVAPFIAPHIVISEAPTQNPWELDCIYAPPQHCYYGTYLTHPSFSCVGPCCSYSAYWSVAPPQEFLPPVPMDVDEEQPTIDVETEDAFDVDGGDESDEPETDSDDASTDTPMTPQDGTFVDAPPPLFGDGKPAGGVRFHIDEDDEELPPFDDWYRDIAQRVD
ncbi:hypothetical protein PHLGIDRAFT_32674 [Phlebiopsis gigantea 11061_1 CR5-6]|uniref:Uncharacterized protein n=1 Tax=Phlebiopsis gigantea (strain 11061_1 CR5-6) TaxID=745531 RepID=A0A0C3P474_PHLG1|nr:hypothetical protein PHLGIDRAFT_32674 [Phlebiopsis gigantea 11061_1 CR5-6]